MRISAAAQPGRSGRRNAGDFPLAGLGASCIRRTISNWRPCWTTSRLWPPQGPD